MKALETSLVYAQTGVVNRDYEGEIREAGNTVKIASIGDPTIGNYVKDTDITDPEILTDSEQSLVIDQQKFFNFYVDDIDRAQQNIDAFDEAFQRAAFKLAQVADTFVAANHVNVAAGNLIGSDVTPVVPTSADAYDNLVHLGVKLDEADIPTQGRFVVVPPWFHGLLLKDDRFVKSGTAAGDAILRNAQVGEAAGFSVLKSNQVPNTAGTKYKIIAGHSIGFSYAEQILDIQQYKPEKRFGDAVKGLHVYGGKLVRPSAWAVLTANRA